MKKKGHLLLIVNFLNPYANFLENLSFHKQEKINDQENVLKNRLLWEYDQIYHYQKNCSNNLRIGQRKY